MSGSSTTGTRPEVLLVRHGATEWSESGRHTGRTDLPLLDRGRDEARAAATRLAGEQPALVLVSPLRRARETCELVGFGDRAEVDPDLLEWDYGDYEGRTTPEIRVDVPGWSIWDGGVPGGETIEQVADRVDRVIARCRTVEGEVALFAHGHVLRILAARWCGLDPRLGRHLPLATAAICRLGWERDTPGLRAWNLT